MKHFYQNIQGWFDFQNLYKEMVSLHDNAKFVEVGVWRGKSTCFLAVEIVNQNKKIILDTIDSYEYLTEEYSYNKDVPKQFKKNIKSFKFIKISSFALSLFISVELKSVGVPTLKASEINAPF